MVKIIILFASIFILLGCNSMKNLPKSNTDAELGTDSYEVSGIKVFTSLSGVSSSFRQELNRKKVKRAILINGGQIDIADNYEIQKTKIQNYLDKAVPNTKTEALIIIDIEGDKMKNLAADRNSDNFKKALDYYLEVFKFTKKCRPNATIGIYGLPWRDYWNRDAKWRKKNESLLPIIKEVDALFPSVYDFYEDGVDVSKKSDSLYIKDNIEESLRIADIYDKPVYPLVWHRYHHSNKKKGLKFIDKTEFFNQIKTIANTNYEGKRITGIIWWSSERYFYNISERGKRNRRNTTDFESYSNKYSYDYLEYLIEGLKPLK